MEILWILGAVLCFHLIKSAVDWYKEYMRGADDIKEERITELIRLRPERTKPIMRMRD